MAEVTVADYERRIRQERGAFIDESIRGI